MKFWLGIVDPSWLAQARVPVLISYQYCGPRPPRAAAPWFLDSGAWGELLKHGRWRITPTQHVARVRELSEQIGVPEWVGCQDWLCSPSVLKATDRTLLEHQRLTVDNLLELRALAPEVPWLPALQGWSVYDYDRHLELYAAEGVELTEEPLVGFGSIGARQHDPEVGRIARHLAGQGLRLHGFGVKKTGIRMYADALASADSSAWSVDARYLGAPPDRPVRGTPECEEEYRNGTHNATCAACLRFALKWRQEVLDVAEERLTAATRAQLFTPDDSYQGESAPARRSRLSLVPHPPADQLELESDPPTSAA